MRSYRHLDVIEELKALTSLRMKENDDIYE